MASRLEAAQQIAERVNSHPDFAAKVWTKHGEVRLYLKKDSGGKKGWIEAGQIDIGFDGTITVSSDATFAFRYYAGVLSDALAGVIASAEEKPVRQPAVAAGPTDELDAQHEQSVRDIYNSESAREIG